MNKICIFVGLCLFSWLGWWIGKQFGGMMTAFIVSSIGSLLGVYVGWKVHQNYLS